LIVYQPESDAFFSGDDPVSFWLQVPGLTWQSIVSDFDHDELTDFDPYQCRLTLLGLTTVTADELKANLDYVWDSVQTQYFNPAQVPEARIVEQHTSEPNDIQRVLLAQLGIIKELPDNPNPVSTLFSVSQVLTGLSIREPSLKGLPAVCTENGELNPDFLVQFEQLLQGFIQLPANINESAETSISAPKKTENRVSQSVKQDNIKTVKVDQDKLEQLVDLTGELIVAKNSMQHLARRVETEYGIKALSRDIKSEHAVLNRITESLQDVVMQIRMIPVSVIFQRFPKLVRELSRKLGKQIDLQVSGEETEADKNIVEQLADPLIHLVRNSIDHGIEMPDIRENAGKSTTGTIRLMAKNVQDSVCIEIHDDGAGIDPQVIREKAVKKGLITEEQSHSLSDEDSLNLIFEPGFSTKEQVSDLSGRGVGMDVVRTSVNRIGGTVVLKSEKGKGSVITVTLPASITVTRVMMFEVDSQVYGIPVEGLNETIKINPNQIRCVKRGESYVLRNKLIPLYRMNKLLGINRVAKSEEMPILNLNINGTTAGFIVDKLLEGVDVIIKPLEGIMSRFPLYSGAAVLGDGRVLLVINPKEISLCQ
jgi:two-component system, chemotaxis family, sensor kinase CheA